MARLPWLLAFRLMVILFGILIPQESVWSQNSPKEDSLLQVLTRLPDDSNKVNLYNELFKAAYQINLDRALKYGQEGLALAKSIGFQNGISKINNNLGATFTRLGNLSTAVLYLNESYQLEKSRNNPAGLARTLNNLGSVNYKMGNYLEARRYYEQSLPIFTELKDTVNVLGALNNIGSCYQEQGYYAQALEFFMRAIQGCEEMGDEEGQAMPLGNAGVIYLSQEQDSLAQVSLTKSIAIYEKYNNHFGRVQILRHFGSAWYRRKDYGKAMEFYQRSLDLCVAAKDVLGEAETMIAICDVKNAIGKREEVLPVLLNVLATYRSMGNKQSAADVMNRIGEFLIEDNKPREAIPYLQESLDTSIITGARDQIADNYKLLSLAWAKMGQFQKAYDNLQGYVHMNDSLFSKENAAEIADILNRYQKQKIEKELNELKLKNDVYESNESRGKVFRIFLISVLALAVLLAVLFYILFRQRSRSSRVIAVKNLEIQAQRDLVEQQNIQIRGINTGLERIVAERTRNLVELNREMDSFLYESAHALRRPITSIRGLLDLLLHENKPASVEILRNNIHFTLSRMDNMLHKLVMVNENNRKPVESIPVTLSVLIKDALDGIDMQGAEIEINAPDMLPVHLDAFRVRVILNNLLENAFHFRSSEPGVKHHVKVDAERKGNLLVISIYDNGRGLPPDLHIRIFEMFLRGTERSAGNGLGLYVVKKMTDKLNGTIVAESVEGKFCRFTLSIPLQK